MKNWIKRFFIFVLIIIFIVAFSDSYSTLSVDNLSTVIAIAVDKSETSKLRVSFQFTNASSVSENGSSEPAPSTIYSIDASSISNAINIMNSYVGKEINLSHCKVIVFSEELAREGISDEIYTFFNNAQIRPSINVVVSKCEAKYYLENTKPLNENLLTKYYEIFANSSRTTGFTTPSTLNSFFEALTCNACEAYAILGDINSDVTSESSSSSKSESKGGGSSSESKSGGGESEDSGFGSKSEGGSKDSDSGSKSQGGGDKGSKTTENIGVAVFKGDRVVGELSAIETISLLSTKNMIDSFLVSVPDVNNTSLLDIHLTPTKRTSIKTEIVNGSPFIKVSYYFTGRVYSMKDDTNYLDEETLDKISANCEDYLKREFSNFLYRTSKDLKSDINSFGHHATRNFLSKSDFDSYDWSTCFADSFFDVSVDTSIKSGYLLTET